MWAYRAGWITAQRPVVRPARIAWRHVGTSLTHRTRLDIFRASDGLHRRVLLGAAAASNICASVYCVTILGLLGCAGCLPTALYHFGVVMMRIARNITAFGLLFVLTLAAASCSPGGTATVLLDDTTGCMLSEDQDVNNMQCTTQLSFRPTAANQMIRVTITATLADARPSFTILDGNGAQVDAQPDPADSNPSVTFTSTNTTAHVISIDELGNADAEYRVLVEVL